MILKKPYAFFIKNFKLFHLVIFVLSAILLYRTSLIYNFMKEYAKQTPNVIGKDLTSSLYSPWLYILILLLITINIIIIVVMIKKSKPSTYYIINILLYISVLVVYILSHNVIKNLESIIVSTKTVLAIRDILNIARLLQSVSTIFYLIRATGFDIKKFDFVSDLQGLDISEEDSEEIEVALEFETNEIIRNIKRILRNAKYYYKENKFILNMIFLLIISLIFLLIYLNINKYNRTYSENQYVNVGNINLGVKQSSIITKDYKGNQIVTDEYALVTVKISLNSNLETTLQTSRTALEIDETRYYPSQNYQNSILDLGTEYNNQIITSEFKDYVLVFKIPKENINSTMTFKYIDDIEYKRGKTKAKSIDIKLNPKNFDELKNIEKQYELGSEINTEETLSDNYIITITNYEIKDMFTNTYTSCITQNECYEFKEIIKSEIERNQEKAVLKIEGNTTTNGENTEELYTLISKYGNIEYTYNEKKYTEQSDFIQIIPTKTNESNIYYIEINKDIQNASEIKLSFEIRNTKYQYILKGGNENE